MHVSRRSVCVLQALRLKQTQNRANRSWAARKHRASADSQWAMPAIACARTPQTPTTSLARVRSPAHAPCRTQAAMHTHTKQCRTQNRSGTQVLPPKQPRPQTTERGCFPNIRTTHYNFDSRTNFKEELWGIKPAVAPSINRVGGTSEFCSHGAGDCW